MKIRFAVTPPASVMGGAVFAEYLRECERLGFDGVWLSDIPLGPLGDPLLDLSYAAAITTRLRLGANIVPLGRHPLWLARQLAQLDGQCNGRLLLSFVPGLGSAAERAALGYAQHDRGTAMDDMLILLRRWWAGEALSARSGSSTFEDLALPVRPVQSPLEVWFGGKGLAALKRVARLGDGWLTAAATPSEAARGRREIERHAVTYGRHIDPEHFGISVPVVRRQAAQAALAALRARRTDGDLDAIVACGDAAVRALIEAHCAAGLSKFVLRLLPEATPSGDWRDELQWLADAVLPLQA